MTFFFNSRKYFIAKLKCASPVKIIKTSGEFFFAASRYIASKIIKYHGKKPKILTVDWERVEQDGLWEKNK